MKTYLKKYEVVDIKGYLDVDADGAKFIMYDEEGQEARVDADALLEAICGNYIQIKTLAE